MLISRGQRRGAALLLALLAGCTPLPISELVSTNPKLRHEVDVPVPELGITSMTVGETSDRPGTLWVAARGGLFTMVNSGKASSFGAMRPEIEPAFRTAALQYLGRTRTGCELTYVLPVPDLFGFEFGFKCQ